MFGKAVYLRRKGRRAQQTISEHSSRRLEEKYCDTVVKTTAAVAEPTTWSTALRGAMPIMNSVTCDT